MDATTALKLALDPSTILEAQGMTPDPWQREFLLCPSRYVMLCCSRGAGKTRVTSALAVHTALFQPGALVLLVSRAQRQAQELLRYCKQAVRALRNCGHEVKLAKETETQLEFGSGSRILSLPGKEETIRSFQGVSLLILDEAARVPEDLYGSVSPMTGVTGGRQVLLSTPWGQRGFFWREWHREQAPWTRFRIPWQRVPRYTHEFIEEERAKFGDQWIEQEYECSFSSVEGVVYPQFGECLVNYWPLMECLDARPVGGIDWGWHNPFAAIWGWLTRDDVLWICWERYRRQCGVGEHIKAIREWMDKDRSEVQSGGRRQRVQPDPKRIEWYADPSGAEEINQCRLAGWKVLRGKNEIRLGIAAVTARIRSGRLKVYRPGCPNLISESQLYRWPSEGEKTGSAAENPIDEHNHALGALRYLVSRIDARLIGRLRRQQEGGGGADEPTPEKLAEQAEESARAVHHARPQQREVTRLDDEELWQTV